MFCYSPWSNIDFSPTGAITPCCKFQIKHYDKIHNIKTDSITTYANSDFLKQIKTEFSNDQWPIGCERCQIEEQNGIESKRQLDYTRWKDQYQIYQLTENNFITASIAFGNTCNLKCITCGPTSSSKWQNEAKDIYNITIKHHKFFKEEFVTDFVNNAPGIIHIDIPGGEPFLSGVPEQKALLNYYVLSGQASNITLHYTTNATVFPDDEWWDLWTHFKEIDMQLSIDGVGNRYEYIRFPASWIEVNCHIDNYIKKSNLNNFRLSVSHTVSAYNIYYLDEFFTWCNNKGLPRPWLGRVHSPAHMRPGVWPDQIKDKITNHLENSKHLDVKTWIKLLKNTNDSDYFDLFKSKLHEHDDYRKLDFSIVFPELAEFVAK
jgi:MoaA/NifB/PqqE/SkfB family radical SAM enzyme